MYCGKTVFVVVSVMWSFNGPMQKENSNLATNPNHTRPAICGWISNQKFSVIPTEKASQPLERRVRHQQLSVSIHTQKKKLNKQRKTDPIDSHAHKPSSSPPTYLYLFNLTVFFVNFVSFIVSQASLSNNVNIVYNRAM